MGVRMVKPLIWEPDGRWNTEAVAFSGCYQVKEFRGRFSVRWLFGYTSRQISPDDGVETLQVSKELAQKDYEQIVLSCLVSE